MLTGKEAVLEYTLSDYFIIEPGDYVVCAVTQKRIPIDHLRYWDSELQEPYSDNIAAAEGHKRKLVAKG